jgi:hypothetical protein
LNPWSLDAKRTGLGRQGATNSSRQGFLDNLAHKRLPPCCLTALNLLDGKPDFFVLMAVNIGKVWLASLMQLPLRLRHPTWSPRLSPHGGRVQGVGAGVPRPAPPQRGLFIEWGALSDCYQAPREALICIAIQGFESHPLRHIRVKRRFAL